LKDSYPWCLHGMDKGPFFVLIFSFRQAIARPVLRFCGLERFCKMHGAVYGLHNARSRLRSFPQFNARCRLQANACSRLRPYVGNPLHVVVYTNLQKPMHEVVYDFFWAPAAGHNRSLIGEKGILCGRKAAWICLLSCQIVPRGGLYCAGLPVMSDFIPLEK